MDFNHRSKSPLRMKKAALFAFSMVVAAAPAFTQQQEYDIKKIDVSFVDTPAYQVNPPARQVRSQKWLAIEVTFEAKPDFTDELIFNYYIYFNKRLFVGQINHVTIEKGRELRSIAYMSPRSIRRIMEGQQVKPSDLENVAITIAKPGIPAPVASKSFKPSRGDWWTVIKQEPGFVLNKSETPFAPLSWDYYEDIKSSNTR